MARNASGNYALPTPETPFIPNTSISSMDVNTVMSDIGTEITNSLDRGGRGAMTNPLVVPVGSAAAPTLTFVGDTDTGIYEAAANQVGIATGGTQRALIDSTALTIAAVLRSGDGAVGAPAHSFTGDTDTGIYRAGANDLRIAANGADVLTCAAASLTVNAAACALPAGTTVGGTAMSPTPLVVGGSGVAFQNSWVAGSFGTAPRYWKDIMGVVHLDGVTKNAGTVTSVAFTLPSGYRPSATQVVGGWDATTHAATEVSIATDGTVGITEPNSNDNICLTGITFPTF